MSRYDDIIDLPRPFLEDHPPMSRHDRAAQFSPFAALTGYEDAVGETARLTDDRLEADEQRTAEINDALRKIADDLPECTEAEVVYFVPDMRKKGGRYVSIRGHVRLIDEADRLLIFREGMRIAIDDIYEMRLNSNNAQNNAE